MYLSVFICVIRGNNIVTPKAEHCIFAPYSMAMTYQQSTSWCTRNLLLLLSCIFCLCSCARKITETGKASFYADKFEGRKTSSGEVFRQNRLTAAHRTLPFGTKVKVVNLANGRSVKVTITDRGPFAPGRIIDVSKKAARKLGMVDAGVASVEIRYKKKRR